MIIAIKIGFLEMRWIDVVDIFLVAFLLFQFYKLLRGSVALRIFFGFLSLYLIYLIVSALKMELLSSILGQFMGVGVLAVLILFQQEIRRFLLLLGRTASVNKGFLRNFKWGAKTEKGMDVTPFVEAAKTMGKTNTGALIVFAKKDDLGLYADSGDRIGAKVSKRLLLSIFFKNSPLHDGAVIISENHILAARCVLPVSEKDIDAQFGLRHRAAMGISEITDAVVLLVSEETGQISISYNGRIKHNLSGAELRQQLQAALER